MNSSRLPYARSFRDLRVYQHWLETAKDDGYLAPDDCRRLIGICEEIGRMLGKMMETSDSFCTESTFREDQSLYFCSTPRSVKVDCSVTTDY